MKQRAPTGIRLAPKLCRNCVNAYGDYTKVHIFSKMTKRKRQKMKILIDNGHGMDTPGKRSPDGKHREWAWTREVAQRIAMALNNKSISAQLLVTEITDIPLAERVHRVNNICRIYGNQNVILVSIHNNAAGADGKWHDASGWSGYVAPNASDKSKRLAQLLYVEAVKLGLKGNRAVPASKYWQGNFAIVRDTLCPAVLTENLFQDNKADVEYLLSEKGKADIVQLHVNAILNYIEEYSQ